MRVLLVSIMTLFASFGAFGQASLFEASKSLRRSATLHAEETQGLRMNEAVFRRIRAERSPSIQIELAMPNGGVAITEWQSFCNVTYDFAVGRQTSKGLVREMYFPEVLTYEMIRAADGQGRPMTDEGFAGVLVLHTNRVQSTMVLNGRQWEVAPEKLDFKNQELVKDYVFFDVSQSAATNTFTCAVDDQHNRMTRMERSLMRESANLNASKSLWMWTITPWGHSATTAIWPWIGLWACWLG